MSLLVYRIIRVFSHRVWGIHTHYKKRILSPPLPLNSPHGVQFSLSIHLYPGLNAIIRPLRGDLIPTL